LHIQGAGGTDRQLSKSPLPPAQPFRLCFECQRPIDHHQDSQDGPLDGFPNPSWLISREPSARRDEAHPGHARWVSFITRQVYEANPPLGPQGGGPRKVIAVIERPAAVGQILDHLGLPIGAASLRVPPDPPEGLAADQPREWGYEPALTCLCLARRQATSPPRIL
jgi:hypothetical protein